jgi:hypothetical protein
MVFGWFKKKKKTPDNQLNQSKTTNPQGSTVNTSQSLPSNRSQTMQHQGVQNDNYEDVTVLSKSLIFSAMDVRLLASVLDLTLVEGPYIYFFGRTLHHFR